VSERGVNAVVNSHRAESALLENPPLGRPAKVTRLIDEGNIVDRQFGS
jgi:hypothetical protein